jgi:TolA protein
VIAELLKHPRALVLSLVMHLAVIALMVLNLTFADKPKHIKAGTMAKTVQAEMVDLKAIEEQKKQKQLDAKRKADAEQKKKLEAKKRADKKKREADQKRKKEQQKKADLKKKKQAEAKRKKEAARKKEQKRSADAKRKADEKRKADAKRQADEKKKADEKQKIEKARIADEKRKAEEVRVAEEKRKAEEARIAEEKRKADEARRQAEEQRRRAEAELKARMLAEENQQKLNSLRELYILAIKQKVERKWIKPAGSGKMPVCEVHVVQGPGGIILDVDFGACGGSTATYRASIENAVYKADPLPEPGDPKLFERELNFFFKPSE